TPCTGRSVPASVTWPRMEPVGAWAASGTTPSAARKTPRLKRSRVICGDVLSGAGYKKAPARRGSEREETGKAMAVPEPARRARLVRVQRWSLGRRGTCMDTTRSGRRLADTSAPAGEIARGADDRSVSVTCGYLRVRKGGCARVGVPVALIFPPRWGSSRAQSGAGGTLYGPNAKE